MINLKFVSPYISIEAFEPITISDFSLITGLNGSGKTHFLKALANGHISAEGIDNKDIIYYNYDDFKIGSSNRQSSSESQITRNKRLLYSTVKMEEINNLRDSIRSKLEPQYEPALHSLFVTLTYLEDVETLFDQKMDIDLFNELIEEKNIINSFDTIYKSRFTPGFSSLVQMIISSEVPIESIQLDEVKIIIIRLKSKIELKFKEENEELYNLIKSSGKDVLSITHKDFDATSFFIEEITEKELQYQARLARNKFAAFQNKQYGSKKHFYETPEFIKTYGLNPVAQINAVLTEYDCNGYQLYCNEIEPEWGYEPTALQLGLRLKHTNGNYEASFHELSSGEQTLIALSLLISETNSKILPRLILLDEIDSSLHPTMISRLLKVIKEKFVEKHHLKVIMVTHSPTTVALAPNDSIFIVYKTGDKKIRQLDRSEAIEILTEGFAVLNPEDSNLGIAYNIEHSNLPVLFTEGITDKIIIEEAWKKLHPKEKMPFYIQDCFDASFLGNLFRRGDDPIDGIFVNYSNRLFIGLFDFDGQGYTQWHQIWNKETEIVESDFKKCLTKKNLKGNGYILLLPVPDHSEVNKLVLDENGNSYKGKSLLTIEMLLYGITELNSYFSKESLPGGGKVIRFIGNKRKFALNLKSQSSKAFDAFIPLFTKIEEIVSSFNA